MDITFLNDELLQDEREEVVKEAENQSGQDGDEDDYQGEADCLTAGRPRDVSELSLGIFEVIDESVHFL